MGDGVDEGEGEGDGTSSSSSGISKHVAYSLHPPLQPHDAEQPSLKSQHLPEVVPHAHCEHHTPSQLLSRYTHKFTRTRPTRSRASTEVSSQCSHALGAKGAQIRRPARLRAVHHDTGAPGLAQRCLAVSKSSKQPTTIGQAPAKLKLKGRPGPLSEQSKGGGITIASLRNSKR